MQGFLLPIIILLLSFCELINAQHNEDHNGRLLATSPSQQPSTQPTPLSYLTAGIYSFSIPVGVSSLLVDLYGAAGIDSTGASPSPGGKGAHIQRKVTALTAGQVLQVTVGSQGGSYGAPGSGTGGGCGAAGGGYTSLIDMRLGSGNIIVAVAGGGGGGGGGGGK